jgi:hypothetical protein
MHLTKPENENYAATVVSIKEVHPLEGCDNVQGTIIFGFQAIVGKDVKPGDLGLVFPAETQLSDEYTSANNLYRHADKNADKTKTGYIEDNRRIRAMKFRKQRSDCLFMPLESLSYIKKFDISKLSEGDTFDKVGDHEICNKYVIKRKVSQQRVEKNKDKFVRVDKKFLPEHYDSDNYFRYSDTIPPNREIIVTQKLHGTSIRIGNTIVARRLGLREQIAKRLGISVKEQEYDYIFGSRKVIKDVNNPNQNHFYDTDIWTEEGKKLEGTIPEGFVLYGELVGWTPENGAIQRNYTYDAPVGTCDLYIYRVAFVNPDGFICDLAWDQAVEFCKDRGLKTVPTLWKGVMGDFRVEDFMDVKYREMGYVQAIPLAKESPCDEGVCIRVDGIAPYILKAKSPMFLEHETKMMDQEVEDIEETQK